MDAVKICCISDLHGHLPELPKHDLLLVAGDLCPATNHTPSFQRHWLATKFLPWLESHKSEKVVVWGNHDLIAENSPELVPPQMRQYVVQDESVTRCGLKVWGSPWQLRFFNWAFNLDERELAAKYAAIPDNIDIIVTHGPPYGAGDLTSDGRRVGSPNLTREIQRMKTPLLVTGHIHNARGYWRLFDTRVVNAAICNEDYRPNGKPFLVELPAKVAAA